MVDSISGLTSLLAYSVQPPSTTTGTGSATSGSSATIAAGTQSTGNLNTFALSVLAQVLEQEESLVDPSNTGNSQAAASSGVVTAATSLSDAQGAAQAYQAASVLQLVADSAQGTGTSSAQSLVSSPQTTSNATSSLSIPASSIVNLIV